MFSTTTQQTDARGVPVSGCQPASLDDYEAALTAFQSYFGDPTSILAGTLERDPDFVMGHVFNASAMLMMSERQYLPLVRQSVAAAEALASKANERERMLTRAARQWMEGDWLGAGQTWDRVLALYPADALAVQCGHLTDFYTGDAVNLRDRIGRVIGQWDRAMPGYSYVLGMQAFGFEECNQFDRAEFTAREALEIEARDGWSVHAVAHVMEMQNRYQEGQQFLRERVDDWAPDNGFAFHNWWHLALYHLEQKDFAGALGLYDEQILPAPADVSLQLLDASALLWRLTLYGVDTADRWNRLADMWADKTASENGYYAFNDLHAVMAFTGAGRLDEAREVRAAVQHAAERGDDLTADMARRTGIPACDAFIAFAEGRYGDCVDTLMPMRTGANRFGGSNAQRDVLTQTLTEAAIRDGRKGLAQNLVSERSVHKPFSPLTRRFASLAEMAGNHSEAA